MHINLAFFIPLLIIIANLVVFIHIVSRGVKILHEENQIYDLLTLHL